MREKYGTYDWFEGKFKMSDDDPWGHNFRGVEHYRYDLIIKLLKKHVLNENKRNNEFKVLDIGCTTGDFTNRLYALNKNVTGIDISPTAIKRAKAKFDYIDFRIDSLPKSCFFNDTFDVITCLEVLYYMNISTQRIFLGEMRNLLKEGGWAVVTSVIGEKPYFKSKELISLLSEYFEVKAVEYYAPKAYFRIENILFNKYIQIIKIQKLLTLDRQKLDEEFVDSHNLKKRIIINIIRFVIKVRYLNFLTYVFLQVPKSLIRVILSMNSHQ